MMTKRGGKRKTVSLNLDEDDETPPQLQSVTPPSQQKSPTIQKSPKISSKIDDDSDEENDKISTFKIRKSKQSRKLEKKKRDAAFLKLADSNNTTKDMPISAYYSTNVDYSKENMEEMKKEFTVRLVNNQVAVQEEERTLVLDDDEFVQAMNETGIVPLNEQPKLIQNTLIPTEDRIAQIRKKRDRLRQLGVTSAEYMAMTSHKDEDESTLIREDDHDANEEHEYDDWNETGNRRAFGDPGKKQENRSLYDIEMGEDEDEDNQWESGQLAKVGIKAKPKVTNEPSSSVKNYPYQKDSQNNAVYNPTDINFIIRKMRENLQEMKEVRQEHLHQQDRIKAELFEIEFQKQQRSTQGVSANEELLFFQELRDYCFDLMDCLEEKSNEVNSLQKKIHTMAIETATNIRRRKQDFIDDELAEVREILGEKGSVDKEEIRKERKGHQRKKQEKNSTINKNEEVDPEGWSSEESEEVCIRLKQDYEHQRELIADEARDIMSDVHDDFASLSPILAKFADWKTKYPDSYAQAYGTLSLQKICDTFVRQEMIARWEILNFPPVAFEEYEWFEDLNQFLKKSDTQNTDFKSGERAMIQHLISTIIMDPLKQAVMHIYNPFSRRQTNLVLEILKDFNIVSDFTLVSSKIKEIIITANVTIQGFMDTMIILFPPAEKMQQTIVSSFCYRQFWSAVKLFCNALMWYKTLSINIIEEMCMIGFLNGKIIPFLRKSASIRIVVESLEKIIKGMTAYLRDSKGIPRALLILHDFVINFSKKILENAKQSSTTEKLSIRLLLVLKKLNDREGAEELAKKFQIKINL